MMILIILLISFYPLIFILENFDVSSFLNLWHDIVFHQALKFTLSQALLSSLAATLIAVLCAPGYSQVVKGKKLIKSFLLLPQFLSPTVLVLSLFIFWPQIPLGMTGVVVAHVLMNAGFAIVVIGERWLDLELAWREKSFFLGASPFYTYRRVIAPLMFSHIKNIFLVILIFCLNSLLIPLAMGGGPQASTLEVLIYEKMKAQGDVSGAIAVTLVQWLLQLFLFYTFMRTQKKSTHAQARYSRSQSWSGYYFFTLAVFITLTAPLVDVLKTGILFINKVDFKILLPAFRNSFLISTLVALAVVVLVALSFLNKNFERFTKIPNLNQILIGVSGILIWGVITVNDTAVHIIALTLLYVASFYLVLLRLVFPTLENIKQKYHPLLETMGAGKLLSFKKVYLPLAKRSFAIVAMLGFCWSWGEFSIASLVAPPSSTLPLLVQELIGQYRLEWAASYSLLMIAVGFFVSFMGESFFDGTY